MKRLIFFIPFLCVFFYTQRVISQTGKSHKIEAFKNDDSEGTYSYTATFKWKAAVRAGDVEFPIELSDLSFYNYLHSETGSKSIPSDLFPKYSKLTGSLWIKVTFRYSGYPYSTKTFTTKTYNLAIKLKSNYGEVTNVNESAKGIFANQIMKYSFDEKFLDYYNKNKDKVKADWISRASIESVEIVKENISYGLDNVEVLMKKHFDGNYVDREISSISRDLSRSNPPLSQLKRDIKKLQSLTITNSQKSELKRLLIEIKIKELEKKEKELEDEQEDWDKKDETKTNDEDWDNTDWDKKENNKTVSSNDWDEEATNNNRKDDWDAPKSKEKATNTSSNNSWDNLGTDTSTKNSGGNDYEIKWKEINNTEYCMVVQPSTEKVLIKPQKLKIDSYDPETNLALSEQYEAIESVKYNLINYEARNIKWMYIGPDGEVVLEQEDTCYTSWKPLYLTYVTNYPDTPEGRRAKARAEAEAARYEREQREKLNSFKSRYRKCN